MGVYIPNIEKPKFCKCEEYNCFAWDDEKFKCKITEWKKPCPLIDIVRCGECKYRNKNNRHCDGGGADANIIVSDDHFCSYGERIDENDRQEEWLDFREEQEFNDRWGKE